MSSDEQPGVTVAPELAPGFDPASRAGQGASTVATREGSTGVDPASVKPPSPEPPAFAAASSVPGQHSAFDDGHSGVSNASGDALAVTDIAMSQSHVESDRALPPQVVDSAIARINQSDLASGNIDHILDAGHDQFGTLSGPSNGAVLDTNSVVRPDADASEPAREEGADLSAPGPGKAKISAATAVVAAPSAPEVPRASGAGSAPAGTVPAQSTPAPAENAAMANDPKTAQSGTRTVTGSQPPARPSIPVLVRIDALIAHERALAARDFAAIFSATVPIRHASAPDWRKVLPQGRQAAFRQIAMNYWLDLRAREEKGWRRLLNEQQADLMSSPDAKHQEIEDRHKREQKVFRELCRLCWPKCVDAGAVTKQKPEAIDRDLAGIGVTLAGTAKTQPPRLFEDYLQRLYVDISLQPIVEQFAVLRSLQCGPMGFGLARLLGHHPPDFPLPSRDALEKSLINAGEERLVMAMRAAVPKAPSHSLQARNVPGKVR